MSGVGNQPKIVPTRIMRSELLGVARSRECAPASGDEKDERRIESGDMLKWRQIVQAQSQTPLRHPHDSRIEPLKPGGIGAANAAPESALDITVQAFENNGPPV